VKNKALTMLWYKHLFSRFGARSTITSPVFTHQADFIEIGAHVSIGPFCRIEAHPIHPEEGGSPVLRIGDRVRIGHGVNLSGSVSLVIEDDVLIAGGCYISDNNHSIDPMGSSYLKQPLVSEPTRIGRGAWLGQNVCVLAGSVVGEKSVIGAASVVKGVIPPYSLAAGSPARVVKQFCFETNKWKKPENNKDEIPSKIVEDSIASN